MCFFSFFKCFNFIFYILYFIIVELLDNEILYTEKEIEFLKFKTNLDYKDISERNIDVSFVNIIEIYNDNNDYRMLII